MNADNAIISPSTRLWARETTRRIGRRSARLSSRRPRKLLVIHLDGVPRGLLQNAISAGRMPFFGSLLNSGAYHLDTAFWGSPASTPCFQAGVLYGLRHPNLPAYHWYDRELGRVVKMNVPRDAVQVESRLAGLRSSSLLEGGGTTYLSLFQAAASNQLNMTSLANLRRLGKSLARDMRGLSAVRRQSIGSFVRWLVGDIWNAGIDVRSWAGRLHDWRHEKEYLLNRFFMINLAWRLAHSRALIDMVRGVPAIYLVFGNFDEVAHRRGPLSDQATRELYRVDAFLEELFALARTLDEPYDVYFLTDHGHVDSMPLESRLRAKLEPYLVGGPHVPLPPLVERGLLDGRLPPAPGGVHAQDEPVVIEAGNFAHVYLTRNAKPLEARELLQRHRQLLARAVSLRDVAITAVRRGTSAVAIIRGQVYSPEQIDSAPLAAEFSRRAVVDFLRELPHMPTAGDLALFGDVYQPGGTVGFAWEFGSHGGLTRIETDSVVCWPADVPVDLSALGHSTQLYEKLSEYYRG